MRNANVTVLVAAQAFAACGSIIVIFIGGIIGTMLAPVASFATVPIMALISGVALSTVPAALLMQAIGRRAGFISAAVMAAAGSGLAAYALFIDSFWLFVAAMLPIGANQAFLQQYRFAAAESVDAAMAPRAISSVLLGSIVAAYLGPEVAVRAAHSVSQTPYVGSFVALAGLYLVAALLLGGLRLPRPPPARSGAASGRSLSAVLLSGPGLMAVSGAAIAYMVMTLLMTATPVTMHVQFGHSLDATAKVIQSHVLAMFLPSLLTGRLVARFGPIPILLVGIGFNAVAIGAALAGDSVAHFWTALVTLGLGWNCMFIASTTLLVGLYNAAERFRVQAANDFTVFGAQALASLSAGVLVHAIGWDHLVLVATVPLACALVFATLVLQRSGPPLDRSTP